MNNQPYFTFFGRISSIAKCTDMNKTGGFVWMHDKETRILEKVFVKNETFSKLSVGDFITFNGHYDGGRVWEDSMNFASIWIQPNHEIHIIHEACKGGCHVILQNLYY
jgi:hypothetical protein